jgi:serine/threonine protein phosphatase PrpC
VGSRGDDPALAQDKIHEIKDGDIIIMGSDGLWDNLYDDHIINIVSPFLKTADVIADPD